jgi:lipopolysaccharide transport system ATP-binding protein
MMNAAVTIRNVTKFYRRYSSSQPATLQEAWIKGLKGFQPPQKFLALDDISFELRPGIMTGVIGQNGAGKSTLLRLIGSVGKPDTGSIDVQGRIGALIDLGAGFHPDLTGRENVYINGVISGLTRAEIRSRFDQIVNFAELEQFIDSPLRTYSTGMQMRLAFSVAAHIDPDILLIDEVLAVGDVGFQRKCLDRIAQFKTNGCTILLVSHDIQMVERMCDEVIWMRSGQIAMQGPASDVVRCYVDAIRVETEKRAPTDRSTAVTRGGAELRLNDNRFGSLDMEIVSVDLLNGSGLPIDRVKSGSTLKVVIHYNTPQTIQSPKFSVTITKPDNTICFDTNTAAAGLSIPEVNGEGQISIQMDELNLIGGQYYVDVGVYEKDWTYAYDSHRHVYPFTILDTGADKGILLPPYRWDLNG